jgi:hypothetical protein
MFLLPLVTLALMTNSYAFPQHVPRARFTLRSLPGEVKALAVDDNSGELVAYDAGLSPLGFVSSDSDGFTSANVQSVQGACTTLSPEGAKSRALL